MNAVHHLSRSTFTRDSIPRVQARTGAWRLQVHIDHVALQVGALDRSVRFYTALLGSQVVRRNPLIRLVHLRIGNALIDLFETPSPDQLHEVGGGLHHLSLRLEGFSLSQIARRVRSLGLAIERQVDRNFGATGWSGALYLRDPDGHQIELRAGRHPISRRAHALSSNSRTAAIDMRPHRNAPRFSHSLSTFVIHPESLP